jgi:hypothetical protein
MSFNNQSRKLIRKWQSLTSESNHRVLMFERTEWNVGVFGWFITRKVKWGSPQIALDQLGSSTIWPQKWLFKMRHHGLFHSGCLECEWIWMSETRTAPIVFVSICHLWERNRIVDEVKNAEENESRKQKGVGKEKTWPKRSTFLDFSQFLFAILMCSASN